MKPETLTTLKAILEADNTITPEHRGRILSTCRTDHKARRRLGTVKQAAALFTPPVHPRTVQRYARRGLLQPIRITARQVRWDLEEVERFATGGRSDG